MLQLIADLVEFDLNRFSAAQAIEDFNHKFAHSILKINGEYFTVYQARYKNDVLTIEALSQLGAEKSIKAAVSIEPVRPKTGLYSSPHGLLYLSRIPKRQWLKSLSIDNNYQINLLQNNNRNLVTLYNTILIDKPNYAKESIIHEGIVYLHWKPVGKVVDDIILVTNKNFFEEVKELWNKQYQITLDVKPRQQKDEKLVLDF